MLGFWLPFDFNILAFADISDVIKVSIYPMLPAAGVLLTYALLDGLNTKSRKEYDEYVAIGGFARWFMRFQVAFAYATIAFGVIGSGYEIVFQPGYEKLKGVFPLASLLAFFYLIYGNKHLLELDVRVRVFVVAFACSMPSAAFRAGNDSGSALYDLKGSYKVMKTKESCPGVTGDLVYLGRLGGKYFGMSKADKGVCVFPDGAVFFIKASGNDKT